MSADFTSMEMMVLLVLFILSVSAKQFGKYEFVNYKSTWYEAQQHCRDHYADLSSITSPWVERRLKHVTNETVHGEFWIGLHKVGTTWRWSGGGNATKIPWAPGQPGVNPDEKVACVCWHSCMWIGWHDVNPNIKLPFLCINLILVKQKENWEESMIYCRQKHTKLISLASEAEQLLALSKIKHHKITERVWIGLRYLEDGWLWVNGDPLVYQAWSQGGDQDHQCPTKRRCGALTKEGLWENWDCQEELNFICY